MIYFALPNAKGGHDKQFKIRAPKRSTNSGLKVLPPKGTIATHNTIYSYPATAEEWKFWSKKMLPDLCDKIWKSAVFFYGKVKGTKIKNKSRADAHEEIKESMVGDSGDMFFTGPKPNKNVGEPDYPPSIKIKVGEDKKSKLPILDIFDSVTAKKGKPENKYAIYSHGELLPFQAKHKDDGPANIAKHEAAIAKVKKVWLTRDKVAKEVPYGTVNDVIWNWFGFTRVNGKLWFSNKLCALNRQALSTYTGGGVRQPGEMAENPFMQQPTAANAAIVAAGPPLPEPEEVKERPTSATTAMETTEETAAGEEEEEENKEEEEQGEEEEQEAGADEEEEEQEEEEAGGEEEQEAGGEEEEQEAGGEEEEANEEEEQEEEQAVV
jgi:hypothetical protein